MTKPTLVVEKVFLIARSQIEPDPDQPRKAFDAAELKALAASLEKEGQREPVLVRAHPTKKGKFILVNGERRWRASEIAGIKTLDARIKTEQLSPADLKILQATLNSGKPLTPFEEADLCYELHHEHGLSQQEIADRLGLKRSTVGDRVRLGELPKVWLEPIRTGKLPISAAPIVQRFLPIPEKYQSKLVKATLEAIRERAMDDDGRPPSLEDFEESIEEAAFEYLSLINGPSAELTPKQYDGPVVELPAHEYSGSKAPRRYAADPEIWTPLVEEARKAREAKHAKAVERNTRAMSADEKRWAADRKRQAAALKKKTAERRAQYAAVAGRVPGTLDGAWLLFAVRWLIAEMHNDTLRLACKTLGLQGKKGEYGSWDFRKPIITHAEALSAEARTQLLLQLLLMPDAHPNQYDSRGPQRLREAAKLLGIELAKVKVEEEKPAPENNKRPNKWQRRNKRGKDKHLQGMHDTPQEGVVYAKPAQCIICDCTDNDACDGGCSWLVVSRTADGGRGVCDNCAANAEEAKRLLNAHTVAELHKATPTGDGAFAEIMKARKARGAKGAPAGYYDDDAEEDDDGEGSGWGDGTREDLWDDPEDDADDDSETDAGDDEDLEDEDLTGDELVEDEEPVEAARP